MHYLMEITDSLAVAARLWEAACSTAGAYAPKYIVAALLGAEVPDLYEAAMDGTETAQAQIGDGEVRPRGVELEVRGGRVTALLWRTESHLAILQVDGETGQFTLLCTERRATERYVAARRAWTRHHVQPVIPGPELAALLGGYAVSGEHEAAETELGDLVMLPRGVQVWRRFG